MTKACRSQRTEHQSGSRGGAAAPMQGRGESAAEPRRPEAPPEGRKAPGTQPGRRSANGAPTAPRKGNHKRRTHFARRKGKAAADREARPGGRACREEKKHPRSGIGAGGLRSHAAPQWPRAEMRRRRGAANADEGPYGAGNSEARRRRKPRNPRNLAAWGGQTKDTIKNLFAKANLLRIDT